MSDLFQSNDNNLTIQTDPTVTLRNGMTLWLAKPGESFELNQYDWDLIQRIDKLADMLGKYRYANEGDIVSSESPSSWSLLKSAVNKFFYGVE